MYLRLVQLSTLFVARPDVIMPSQVLDWAQRITEPIAGVAEQGRFVKTLFPRNVFDREVYDRLPKLTKVAIKSPPEIWPSLGDSCVECSADGRSTCSRCGIAKYCGRACQERFAKLYLHPRAPSELQQALESLAQGRLRYVWFAVWS